MWAESKLRVVYGYKVLKVALNNNLARQNHLIYGVKRGKVYTVLNEMKIKINKTPWIFSKKYRCCPLVFNIFLAIKR